MATNHCPKQALLGDHQIRNMQKICKQFASNMQMNMHNMQNNEQKYAIYMQINMHKQCKNIRNMQIMQNIC